MSSLEENTIDDSNTVRLRSALTELAVVKNDLACAHAAASRQASELLLKLHVLERSRSLRWSKFVRRLLGLPHNLDQVASGRHRTDAEPHKRLARELVENRLIDEIWYLDQYPDVRMASIDPALHYLTAGSFEGRWPNRYFDPHWYRAQYPASLSMDPLEHYFRIGRLQRLTTSYDCKASLTTCRKKALGLHTVFDGGQVVIGIARMEAEQPSSERCLQSCNIALRELPGDDHRVLVSGRDDHHSGMFGLHARFMRTAFEAGAHYYLAVRDGTLLEPLAVFGLAAMARASDDRALIEATRFPDESLKFYDPATFSTFWASATCVLIPRTVFERIGGFDPQFVSYCGDVDLSWRAREAGFLTQVCPRALVSFSIDDEQPWQHSARLADGLTLARKWNSKPFERKIRHEANQSGIKLPAMLNFQPRQLPSTVADFNYGFAFSPSRFAS